MAFGEFSEEIGYHIVDEEEMGASAKILYILAVLAFINGFILNNFEMITLFSAVMLLNFAIGLVFGARYAPTIVLGRWMVKHKEAKPIGAIQKQFAWAFGLVMALSVFILSLFLLQDSSYFMMVCMLCIMCLTVLYFEVVMNICVGCKIYGYLLARGWVKAPEIRPACTGDACSIE